MSGFRLSWAEQSIDVDSSALVGREDPCEIMLDDPLVSRRHAKISVKDGKLWLEDLGSRNGLHVNGSKVNERQRLFSGDVIRIGNQEIVVVPSTASERITDEGGHSQPTKRFDALGVVGHLADKALALGHPEEAERLMSAVLEQILRECLAGLLPSANTLEKATAVALRILLGTGRGIWLDWLVQVYTAMQKPWPATVVDQLYDSGRSTAGYDRHGMRGYCELLRAIQSELGPAERFQVGRIEGLERVLSAR